MSDYEELQDGHRRLLETQERGADPAGLLDEVRAYIEQARQRAESVTAPRDRDQLRANLRYWAAFVFDRTGNYPDTRLRPARLAPPGGESSPGPEVVPARPMPWVLVVGLGVIVVLIVIGSLLVRGINANATYVPTGNAGNAGEPTVLPPTPTPLASATKGGPAIAPTVVSTPTPPPTPTPLGGSGGSPTGVPTVTALPNTGGGGFPYERELWLADVQLAAPAAGCDRTVAVTLDGPVDGAAEVALNRVPGGEPITRAPVREGRAALTVPANAADWPRAALLSVRGLTGTFAAVIVQFNADCQTNQVTVRYAPQTTGSMLEAEPDEAPGLKLDWQLANWGTVPGYPGTWAAQVRLRATGGNGQYLFFGGFDQPLTEPLALATGFGCAPAQQLVGVSSAGRTVIREIVIVWPGCLKG